MSLLLKFQARHPQSETTFPAQLQLPPLQMFPGVRLQFVEHEPQWRLFWSMSTQPVLLQFSWFWGQPQVPLLQLGVELGQACPQ
jgi:hypothetical protein